MVVSRRHVRCHGLCAVWMTSSAACPRKRWSGCGKKRASAAKLRVLAAVHRHRTTNPRGTLPVACVRRTTLAATDTTLAVMLSMVAWAVAAAVLLPWWRGCSVYVSSAPGLSMPGLVFSSLRSSRCVVFGEQYSTKPLVVQTKARTHGHTQHAHASTLPHRPSGSVAHRLTHRRVCGVSVDCEAHASQLASGQQQPQVS